MGTHNISAVELVPHDAVVEAGRLLHQPGGELLLRHRALHQKAERLHLRRAFGTGVVLGAGLGRRDAVVMRNDKVCAALLGAGHQHFGRVGLDGIVGVDKLQIFALRLAQPHVAGRGDAAVRLVDKHDAVVDVRVHLAHVEADVPAAVVQQQDLKVFVGLAADALDAAGDMILCVINRYDDADKRLFRHGGRPPFFDSIPTIPYFCPFYNGKKPGGVV